MDSSSLMALRNSSQDVFKPMVKQLTAAFEATLEQHGESGDDVRALHFLLREEVVGDMQYECALALRRVMRKRFPEPPDLLFDS